MFVSRVNGLKTFQTFTESWREPFIGLGHVAKKCVASSVRNVEGIQERGSRGLVLVCDVAVPGDGVGPAV